MIGAKKRLILLLRELSGLFFLISEECSRAKQSGEPLVADSGLGKRLENSLSHFPPQHAADYRCLDGMRQHLNKAVNLLQGGDIYDESNLHDALALAVSNTLDSFVEREVNTIWRYTPTVNQIHLPALLTSYVVGLPFAKKIDGNANCPRPDIPAAKIFDIRQRFTKELTESTQEVRQRLLSQAENLVKAIEFCDIRDPNAGVELEKIRKHSCAELMIRHLDHFDPTGEPLLSLDEACQPFWDKEGCQQGFSQILNTVFDQRESRSDSSSSDMPISNPARYRDQLSTAAIKKIANTLNALTTISASVQPLPDEPLLDAGEIAIDQLYMMIAAGGGSKLAAVMAVIQAGDMAVSLGRFEDQESGGELSKHRSLTVGIDLLHEIAQLPRYQANDALQAKLIDLIDRMTWIHSRSEQARHSDIQKSEHPYYFHNTLIFLSDEQRFQIPRHGQLASFSRARRAEIATVKASTKWLIHELIKGSAPVALWEQCLRNRYFCQMLNSLKSFNRTDTPLPVNLVHPDLAALSDLLKAHAPKFHTRFMRAQLDKMIRFKEYDTLTEMATRIMDTPLFRNSTETVSLFTQKYLPSVFELAVRKGDRGIIEGPRS